MWFCTEMDNAFREDRLEREKEEKKQEKIVKLKAKLNNSASTDGEKQSIRLALKRLAAENI